MTLGHNDKRTSAQQLMWVWNKISGFFKGLFSHIRRCRGVYSFLLGALSTLLFLAAFIWYGVLAYPLPWKVISSNERGFRSSEFKFTDYTSDSELQKVLDSMFPIGTDKSSVDLILVEKSRARVVKYHGPDPTIDSTDERYYYTYVSFRGQFFELIAFVPQDEFVQEVTIVYTKNGKLKSLHVI